MQPKYLIDIASTQAKQRFPSMFEKCCFVRIDEKDFIRFEDYICNDPMSKKTPVACYSDNCCLVDFLEIGRFVHAFMTKTYSNITSRLVAGDIKKSRLYKPLIEKILSFSKKYGNFEPLKEIENGKPVTLCHMMSVNSFIQQASRLYLLYRDFEQDNNYIYSQAELLRLDDLAANVIIAPTINKVKGKRKITLDYEFWEMIDLLKYQLLISFMGDCKTKIGLCQYCNKFFTTDRKKMYCSNSCANQSSKNRTHESVKLCATCGQPFEPGTQKSKYCSTPCKRKRDNLAAKERSASK